MSETEPTSQKTIKSIAFSSENKHIAVIIQGAECKAIAWEWYNKNKPRIIGQYEFNKHIIDKISFSPKESHLVCTSGHAHWKLWKP